MARGVSDCVALETMRLTLWEWLSGGEWPAAARGNHLAHHTLFTQSQAEHLGLLAGKVCVAPLVPRVAPLVPGVVPLVPRLVPLEPCGSDGAIDVCPDPGLLHPLRPSGYPSLLAWVGYWGSLVAYCHYIFGLVITRGQARAPNPHSGGLRRHAAACGGIRRHAVHRRW